MASRSVQSGDSPCLTRWMIAYKVLELCTRVPGYA